DLVGVPYNQSEVRGCGCVQRDAAAEGGVNAAEIDHELSVDEHPDIVVTREAEDLSTGEGERVTELAREVEVLPRRPVVSEPQTIERDEVVRAEHVRVVGLLGERQRAEDHLVVRR